MTIDDCLSERDGLLYIEQLASTELVERFGSPLFVFSEDQIRRNVRRFQAAFGRGWSAGPVQVMPAVKANWAEAVQRILVDEGCGADVYSAGELEIALRAGAEPGAISVNGVPKEREHIERTLDVGAMLTIDSLRDVEILESLASQLQRPAKVRLRLRPAVSDFLGRSDFVPEGAVTTDMAALAYKGGLCLDEVIEAGKRVLGMPNVELTGFHEHHGRHHPSAEYWRAQMRAFARDAGIVCKALGGFKPRELDIGGGFATPRSPLNAATNYSDPFVLGSLFLVSHGLRLLGSRTRYRVLDRLLHFVESRPNQKPAPTIEDYAAACTETLLVELPRHGIDPNGITLQLEPGRAIHGNAGVHLATVRATKRRVSPVHWNVVTVDTTEFWLTTGRLEKFLHDFRLASRMDAPATMKADVVGRSCAGDRLLGAVKLPEVQIGDVLAFLDTGAYQEVSCSNFNAMPRPAAVLVTGADAAVIRRAETLDDVLSRDQIPPHLRSATRPRAVG